MALLDPVRELLPDADHWCQRRSRDKSPDGTPQVCLMEALWVAFIDENDVAYTAGISLAREKGYRGGSHFNDARWRTFDDIRQFIDELEARLETA